MHRLAERTRTASRLARTPPPILARRLLHEATRRSERLRSSRRLARFDDDALLARSGASSIDGLWDRLCAENWPGNFAPDPEALGPIVDRLSAAASNAAHRRVDLLGTGLVELGDEIDWHLDFKTGTRWPVSFGPAIDYAQLDRPSDVKVPWELSRVQWLIPSGQMYLLTRDESHAAAARNVLASWIAANPYARGVNWAIAMEPAFRIFTWTWLFHALARSASWSDEPFRSSFLRALYLHGDFVDRHIERSSVNGNHFTADAAALVLAGLFFGGDAKRWADRGWGLLREELPRQVTDDGVDFEAATAYHRLVAELFLLPALVRRAKGLDVPGWYVGRIGRMAVFANAYTRPDGSSPLWGDADDARALPLGTQPLGDHRYLATIVRGAWPNAPVETAPGAPQDEAYWLLGATVDSRGAAPVSRAFRPGGVYVLRAGGDHVFVDAGPVGLAGRGGHGHNDCLSFEAALDGRLLVTDCGSFVYTADAAARNRFRSTASHNTPRIDDEEQNPLPASLWQLDFKAVPTVERWDARPDECVLVASHAGYRRLAPPVTPRRTFVLDLVGHRLAIRDELTGLAAPARAKIPVHLACGVRCSPQDGGFLLETEGDEFTLAHDPDWEATVHPAWVSPSYGVANETVCVELSGGAPLLVTALGPGRDAAGLLAWARSRLHEIA